jgi:hypothetical protein
VALQTFRTQDLKPSGGTLYGHVFENTSTGAPRSLYWSVNIGFSPVVLDGATWEVSMSCEWIVWPARRWLDLDGASLSSVRIPDLVEASFYIAEHHTGTVTALSLRRRTGASFDVTAGLTVDIDLPDGTALPDAKILADTTITFDGIYVLPNNLVPKPNTPELATAALAPFLSPADFTEPRWDRFRYVFEPIAGIA